MNKNQGEMGMRKHGRSGKSSKSPRFRMMQEIELRKQEKSKINPYQSDFMDIRELFSRKR